MRSQSAFTECVKKYCRIPLLTLFTVSLCCSLYMVDALERVDLDHDDVCLKAHGIIRLSEVYRFFAHVYFHKNLLHLAITMIPIAALGWIIEKRLGTIIFSFNVVIIWLFSSLLEVAMATLLYHISHDMFHDCSIGMSGIMFGLVVLGIKLMKDIDGRAWWGIPSMVYLLLLLGVYYFFVHKGSLFMHLGGIFAGYACTYEVLGCILPNPETVVAWERLSFIQPLIQIPCYVKYIEPASLPLYSDVYAQQNVAQEF